MRRSIAATALVLAAGCEGKSAATTDTTPAVAPAAAAAPVAAVTIVSPADGDTTGPDVTVVLRNEGVTIEKASGVRVEGVGHHHLFLDTPPSPEGAAIPPTSATVVHIGTGDSTYTFKGLSPGAHEIIAVIGYGDHIPMASRRDTLRFVVKR